jgi:hypothetical protein
VEVNGIGGGFQGFGSEDGAAKGGIREAAVQAGAGSATRRSDREGGSTISGLSARPVSRLELKPGPRRRALRDGSPQRLRQSCSTCLATRLSRERCCAHPRRRKHSNH